ncbi:hypothetical protein PVAP13_3NG219900 [Panicum virgatum]|uniref:Terpene synthase N-terminal domain-containing protein n=1 Tax=Panicum virgatum TaxID=38727 RepID=A0A8T0UGP6_PANVG|nr:hypothetical protein PVAP13_3NG219900 [Panicum virgatum]
MAKGGLEFAGPDVRASANQLLADGPCAAIVYRVMWKWRRSPDPWGEDLLGPGSPHRAHAKDRDDLALTLSTVGSRSKGATKPHINQSEEVHDLGDYHVIAQSHGTSMEPLIDEIRAMLRSMNDGELSISAYDTAWVALVSRLDGGKGPQFPSTVQWILNNQLSDGSWGDSAIFSAYDRIINTLARFSYLHQNMWRISEEDQEWMPIGFEIAFPSLIEIAKSLDLDFPYDHHALQEICYNREIKLKRIPKDMMHRVPTTNLDWTMLLKLQSSDGSFLFSPSATAYAFMQTGDRKCFEYIDRIVKKFNGGVPGVYPVDLFEHLWVVDRLQHLGISHHFKREIEQSMDYVNRHWTEEGICWARNSNVKDVDDTAMAFRLLRLHGYNVSPNVFKIFEKDGQFFCFVGQSSQALTGMYNLNRASQISFPGEDVLHHTRTFSYEFLRNRQAKGMLHDKWIVSKDLAGEVQYTLDFPWFASLPRVEARTYLDQYGGGDDIWIAKSFYRMPLVNNNVYLEFARKDFNRCQVLHQHEWQWLQKWYIENGLVDFGVAHQDVLRAYFLAAASIFESSRATERLAWARVSILANTISTHIRKDSSFRDRLECFLRSQDFSEESVMSWLERMGKDAILVRVILRLNDSLAKEAQQIHEGHECIENLLRVVWIEWMRRVVNIKDNLKQMLGNKIHSVQIIEISAGQIGEALYFVNNNGDQIIQLMCSICYCLNRKLSLSKETGDNKEVINHIDQEVDMYMQEFTQYLLRRSNEKTRSNIKTRQNILNIVKTCYYATHCPQDVLDSHISRVIFDPVI